jgi:hypothetical protein
LSLYPDLHLYACNGVVFAGKIFISNDELKQLLINGTYSREKPILAISLSTDDPYSIYPAKWSIVPIK